MALSDRLGIWSTPRFQLVPMALRPAQFRALRRDFSQTSGAQQQKAPTTDPVHTHANLAARWQHCCCHVGDQRRSNAPHPCSSYSQRETRSATPSPAPRGLPATTSLRSDAPVRRLRPISGNTKFDRIRAELDKDWTDVGPTPTDSDRSWPEVPCCEASGLGHACLAVRRATASATFAGARAHRERNVARVGALSVAVKEKTPYKDLGLGSECQRFRPGNPLENILVAQLARWGLWTKLGTSTLRAETNLVVATPGPPRPREPDVSGIPEMQPTPGIMLKTKSAKT